MNWFRRDAREHNQITPAGREVPEPAPSVDALSTRIEEAWSDADAEAELDRLEEEDRAAPFAAMIEHLRQLGFSGDQIVHCVRLVELNRSALLAELSPRVSTKRPRTSKRAKWRTQKRNQRQRLKLVHSSTADIPVSQKQTQRG